MRKVIPPLNWKLCGFPQSLSDLGWLRFLCNSSFAQNFYENLNGKFIMFFFGFLWNIFFIWLLWVLKRHEKWILRAFKKNFFVRRDFRESLFRYGIEFRNFFGLLRFETEEIFIFFNRSWKQVWKKSFWDDMHFNLKDKILFHEFFKRFYFSFFKKFLQRKPPYEVLSNKRS